MPAKDRLTIIDVLTNQRPRRFLVNAEAWGYVEAWGLSAVRRRQLSQLPAGTIVDEATMQALLEAHLPGLGPQQRKWILDATAVAAYHAALEFPVVRLWVCDDAPQFTLVTGERALCWGHEGRPSKKLVPYVPHHKALVEDFVQRFWTYYDQWLAYREQPTPETAARLDGEFEALFSTATGYDALDERMAKTRAKQGCLLRVLAHPDIPLPNNPAALGARARVRTRDVSFGPRTREGAKAWDTFMTLAVTATKLGVSFYHYVHDRVSSAYQMPSLADLIAARAKVLNLGASWGTSSPYPRSLKRYYAATKGAIVAFTRSLAKALVGQGIRVNGVAPGPIWTPLIPSTFPAERVASFGADVPMQRAGQLEEVAPSYVFLASDDASYMTGQILHPNGGEVVNG